MHNIFVKVMSEYLALKQKDATLCFVNIYRVATTQGKQGIWFLIFRDRENTGNFAITQGKYFRHREGIWTVIIDTRIMLLF